MTDELVVEMPVDAAFAVTARRFVVAAARALGLPEGSVEDLRLVASELVANAVESGDPGPIRLTLRSDGDEVGLEASGVGRLADHAPLNRRVLLETLFSPERIVLGSGVHIRVPIADRAILDQA